MADFRTLLATPVSSIEKPIPLPRGQYSAVIEKWEPVESSKQKTPGIKITFKLLAPGADVDEEELTAAGGLAAVQKRRLSTSFWLTDDATYRLREFLEGPCALETDGRSLAEVLPEVVQVQVTVAVNHRLTEKSEVMMEIDQVFRAE